MKVSELIAKLQKIDPNKEVVIRDPDCLTILYNIDYISDCEQCVVFNTDYDNIYSEDECIL